MELEQHSVPLSHSQLMTDQRSDSHLGRLNLGAIMKIKTLRHAVIAIFVCIGLTSRLDSAYAACRESLAGNSKTTASIVEGRHILRYPQAVDNSPLLLSNENKSLWITHAEQIVTLTWGKKQIKAFKTIIYKESRWNPNAYNPATNAYGLGQLINSKRYTKHMPYKQINAAVKYIYNRYGTPTKALAHHNKQGWY